MPSYFFLKFFLCSYSLFLCSLKILNNIFNFVKFLKSKMASPFDWNSKAEQSNLKSGRIEN